MMGTILRSPLSLRVATESPRLRGSIHAKSPLSMVGAVVGKSMWIRSRFIRQKFGPRLDFTSYQSPRSRLATTHIVVYGQAAERLMEEKKAMLLIY